MLGLVSSNECPILGCDLVVVSGGGERYAGHGYPGRGRSHGLAG